jgi:hypothetical protein
MSEARENLTDERVAGPARGGGPTGIVRRVGIYLGVALVIFLLGLVPMWLRAREHAAQRDAAQRELRVSRMQNTLASAIVDAQRGEYEPARQAASDFFTALREQVDTPAGEDAALTPAQRDQLRPLHAQRDEVITLLARSDPASSARLLDLYVAFRKAVLSVPPEGRRE